VRSKLPVLRLRRRYVAFEIDSEDPVSERDLGSEIYSSQLSLFGDLGAARNRLKLVWFDGCYGLLRCHHTSIEETRAVLATIYSVGGIRASIRVKGVSGTIKAATEKYIPQLGHRSAESEERRIELREVSGRIVHIRGQEIDLSPDDRSKTKGSDTSYMGLTSFDLSGGCDDADGTADGLR
jgi:ribonuclease P/MRP protein subunit POP5